MHACRASNLYPARFHALADALDPGDISLDDDARLFRLRFFRLACSAHIHIEELS
jgi:hypothetical protein